MSSKKSLTQEQIKEILDAIPERKGIPEDIAKTGRNKILLKLRKDLSGVKIYPELYDKLKNEIVREYYETLIPAGEAVGILTAQSIGERQTQSTLSSFHSCGLSVKTVITGVPRFSELLNATKNPKMTNCLIFFNRQFESISDIRNISGNKFTEINLKRLIKNTKLIKDKPLEDWHELFIKLYTPFENCHNPLQSNWRFRIEVNINLLYEYNLTLKIVADKIKKEYNDAIVFYSPDWKGILDIFIEGLYDKSNIYDQIDSDTSQDTDLEENYEENENEDEEFQENEIIQSTLVSKQNLTVKKLSNSEDIEEVIDENLEKISYMEDKVLPALLDIKISGMDRIRDIFFEKRNEEWIITTEGSNLQEIFCLPIIDKTRTICNDMWEIYKIFGIEAVRQFLIEEYMDTISSDGTFVNISHVELLVDVMTHTGTIISISRYGQKKILSGPLAMASFEQSLDNFLKSGINGENETTNGVSASIMLGKLPNIGTGAFDLTVDIEKLKKYENSMNKLIANSQSEYILHLQGEYIPNESNQRCSLSEHSPMSLRDDVGFANKGKSEYKKKTVLDTVLENNFISDRKEEFRENNSEIENKKITKKSFFHTF